MSPRPSLVAAPQLGHVALLASFPPRRCGIAAFTADMHEQLAAFGPSLRCDVIAIADPGDDAASDVVKHTIRQDDIGDYVAVARKLNDEGVELVCVQHEFGIFGGDAGDYLLAFLEELACPVVITLHTVLEQPNEDQSRVMAALLRRSARVVVMAERGRRILLERYHASPDKVTVIAHGAPDYPLVDPDQHKARFDLEGRAVLLTFGLLSPNKGIESVIRALPEVIAARPDALYVVLGATHPHLVRREGEAYRERLISLAEELGVGDHVRFVNAYVDPEELQAYLAAADVYVTPYLNEAQITSGTLSYAVAMGKPVVSTPYWHAQELLANDVGVLAPFNDSNAIGAALVELVSDDCKREGYRNRAYAKGRETIWERAGARYLEVFNTAAHRAQRPSERKRVALEAPTIAAVERMSDACGIFQHARFCVPDRAHGYCVDDNARALILLLRGQAAGLRGPQAERLIPAYASFVDFAWNEDKGRFRNFMSYDRRWLEDVGSSDSCGRSLWSLGETARLARDPELRAWATNLAARVIPHLDNDMPLRTLAFSSLGLCSLLAASPDNVLAHITLTHLATRLKEALTHNRKPGWTWFEAGLTYDNARLPEALITAGVALKDARLCEAGLEALAWLAAMQTGPGGVFCPVGNESFGKRYLGPRPYDQQPLEAAAMVDACWAAFEASGDPDWEDEAHRAYGWFFGKNTNSVLIAAPNGGCFDGLARDGVNRNQGAESVLSLQLANCAMKTRDRGRKLRPAR